METICMNYQILFSGKNKKTISKCCPLKILPRVLSIWMFEINMIMTFGGCNHNMQMPKWCKFSLFTYKMCYFLKMTSRFLLNSGGDFVKNGCDSICSNQLFQAKADEAGVIIVVLSEAFSRSKTCQQQVSRFITPSISFTFEALLSIG